VSVGEKRGGEKRWADAAHLEHVGDGLESSVRVVGEPGGLGDCETNRQRERERERERER
jgi:hypothetical protein